MVTMLEVRNILGDSGQNSRARKNHFKVFPDFPGNGSKPWTNFPGFCKNRAFSRGNKKALNVLNNCLSLKRIYSSDV